MIVVLNYALLKYYTDPNENVKVALIAQILAFSSILVYIALVPLDVYATVNHLKTLIFDFQIYDIYFSKLSNY